MTKPIAKKPARATGRRYSSVGALMKETDTPQEVQNAVASLARETQLTTFLARLRQKAGLSQEDMACLLDCSQSKISKLEASQDDELTLGEILDYVRHTGSTISVTFGPQMNHVQAVKMHAAQMRHHLQSLAALAHKGDELNSEIQAFFGEAFFNILNILAECQKGLPEDEPDEMSFQIVDQSIKKPRTRESDPSPACATS